MEPIKTSSPLRVLLVEDDEHDRLAFRMAFQKSQVACEITESIRAEEALERLRADVSLFDLVVIDHKLPGMSGLRLCKELLGEKTPLPLMILTGRGSEQLAVQALNIGVDNYIIKDTGQGYLDLLPVVLPQVVRTYVDHIARKRAEEALRKAHDELEQRVEERTAKLARTTEKLKRELSERQRAEDALRKSEQVKHAILNSMSEYMTYYDAEHRIVWANRVASESVDLASEQLVGRHCYEIWHQRSKPCPGCPFVKTLETLQPQKADMTSPDGRVWLVRTYPVLDPNDDIEGVVEVTLEITDVKRAEEALRESEERHRTVLEALPDPIVVYDMEGKGTYINPAFTKVFGWTLEERLGKKLDYVPEENWPETQMMINKVQAGESFSGVESRRYTKEGDILDVSISATVYLNADGIPVGSVHILRDITDYKRAEEALRKAHDELELRVKERTAELTMANEQLRWEMEGRERTEKQLKASEEKYRILFDYDPNPLFMVDLASAKILDLNRQVTETYQYYREDLLGMSFFDLFDADDAKRLRKELRHLAEKDDYVFVPKLRAMKKDANHFFIDLHARVGKFQEEQHGRPGLSLIIRSVDITLALERQSQLIQASKMATLGAMATGIAHELNQPMSAMQVGGDFIAKMIRRGKKISDEQLLKVSRSISEQVDRAGNIINHLREFGRKSDFKVYPLDLNEPIGDVFTIMGQQLKLRNIEVSLKLDQGLPKILSDKNRLEQIFLNLVANARDAMEAKGSQEIKKLTVVTYRERDTVVAEISDTGNGMPERIRTKIFEPFFTTKEVGKGTGLGLSITYSLVRDFKGDIDVESTQGVGTTFRVRFPAHEERGHQSDEGIGH